MNDTTFYPVSPTDLSKDYTSLPGSYKLKAMLAVLAILLFFVLYIALVVGLGFLCKWAFLYDIGTVNKLTILGKIGAIAGSVMLFVFTLKFIFKLKNHKPENRVKLNKQDHPNLWNFIDKICTETGAPKPKSIYVDPDVNAYVSYTNTWLSLILPVGKDLTIGLGLVSCLNLSEFKAVVSHEFGHFAQSTMKVGSYIMSANTIIHDMIYSRDKWDETLDNWRASDIRISFAAWIITPIIWVIRQLLALFYKFLNIMYSSLSLEMEFNADRVAASTSGSDAIISALWKLDHGAVNWNTSVEHLFQAARKQKFVKNVYSHHELALERLEGALNTRLAALGTHPEGGKQFFTGNEHSKVSMYASHPPNNMREENVKKPYLHCETDNRSPWILFNESQKIQESLTGLIYKKYFQLEPNGYCNKEEFEAFIKNESKGKELLDKFDNVFEQRFVHIPETVDASFTAKSDQELHTDLKALETQLPEIMAPVKEMDSTIQLAHQIANGTTKLKSFSFEGVDYGKKELQAGYEKIMAAREKVFENDFKDWDHKFFSSCLVLAQRREKSPLLQDLFTQHEIIVTLFRYVIQNKNAMMHELDGLQSRDNVSPMEVTDYTKTVMNFGRETNAKIKQLKNIRFTAISNIDDVDELINTIYPEGTLPVPYGKMFENDTFGIFINAVDQTIQQLQRIEQKNMVAILTECEEVRGLAEKRK